MIENTFKIIVGRDANTSQLKVVCGSDVKMLGQSGCVPQTVSREHCSIVKNPDGTFLLTNLKPQNVTYVNGMEINAKVVREGDRIELGPGRLPLSWNVIKSVLPTVVDIRPLRYVWTELEESRTMQQVADRKFNALRGVTGVVTMLAVVLSVIVPESRESPLYLMLYAVAILSTLGFTIKAYTDASKAPQKAKEINDRFVSKYVCPSCGHFMGNIPYNILSQNDCCPYCKAKFKK